jgi:hypothetical protein
MTETHSFASFISLFLALIIYAVWPRGFFDHQSEEPRLGHLMEHKDRLLENMRTLNIEHCCGRCTEEEFFRRQAQLENEASQLLAEIVDVQRNSA